MGEPQQTETIVALFKELTDPRIDRTKGYPLEEILFLVLAAVVSGVNHLTRIELFGKTKLDWLRTILPYDNGIPSRDTIGRVLGLLDSDELEAMFINSSTAAKLGSDFGGARDPVKGDGDPDLDPIWIQRVHN